MREQTTRREHIDMRPYGGITWRGVGVAYGIMMLVFAVMWAISYPVVAATVLTLITGAFVAIGIGARITRRQAQRTIHIPGIDVCFTI